VKFLTTDYANFADSADFKCKLSRKLRFDLIIDRLHIGNSITWGAKNENRCKKRSKGNIELICANLRHLRIRSALPGHGVSRKDVGASLYCCAPTLK